MAVCTRTQIPDTGHGTYKGGHHSSKAETGGGMRACRLTDGGRPRACAVWQQDGRADTESAGGREGRGWSTTGIRTVAGDGRRNCGQVTACMRAVGRTPGRDGPWQAGGRQLALAS